MSCPYEDNAFCRLLSDEIHDSLCAHCHLRKYSRRQRLNYQYWKNLVAVLLDGFMIFGDVDKSGDFSTSGLSAGGYLLSPGPLIDVWDMTASNRDILCMSDCTVAVLDTDTAQAIFQHNIDFVKIVYDNLLAHCGEEKYRYLRNVGSRDTLAAVRYILTWCRDHHIPPQTHEQIALMCNRSRPTVTEAIHTLTVQEPDLFCYKNE